MDTHPNAALLFCLYDQAKCPGSYYVSRDVPCVLADLVIVRTFPAMHESCHSDLIHAQSGYHDSENR